MAISDDDVIAAGGQAAPQSADDVRNNMRALIRSGYGEDDAYGYMHSILDARSRAAAATLAPDGSVGAPMAAAPAATPTAQQAAPRMPDPPPGFVLDSPVGPAVHRSSGFVTDPLPAPPPGFELEQPWLSAPVEHPAPNMAAGNKTFARTLGDALMAVAPQEPGAVTPTNMGQVHQFGRELGQAGQGALQTTEDIGTVYGPLEAAMNAGTGLLFGMPASLGAQFGGLVGKYLLGNGADPKELGDTLQNFFTYHAQTDAGKRLVGNLARPLNLMSEGATAGGHGASDFAMRSFDASPDTAALVGAVTEAGLNVIPQVLLGELGRKMGGQTVGTEDMKNVAKVAAGPDATPAQVAAVESSLHATYDQTGIGPYTVYEAALKDPAVHADLVDPNVGVPKAFEPYVSGAARPFTPTPGDGAPLLDLTEPGAPAERVLQPEEIPTETESQQPSSATYREGAGTLNAGLNPDAVLSAVRDSYTPYVGVEAPKMGPVSTMADALQKTFAPATRGDVAAAQAGIMRANFGELARVREVALEKLKGVAADFDKMPTDENIKFIDAIERGTPLADPKLAQAASELRALLDGKRDEVQALGKGQLENFDENYFPHIWKDFDSAQGLFARRPLTGSGAFLKARTIPYTVDGLRWRAYDAEGDFVKSFDTKEEAARAAGADGRVGAPLTPITTNPVELALLKAREMDKYVYGQKIFAEMKDAGLARFVRFGDRAPLGWTKINDKIARVLQPNPGEAGGMILRGEYYAPDEAATLINNHLSPGLQGNGFYQAWRGVGNAMNALQLGLSFFHVGFTTMDSMISKVALGVKQIGRGDVLQGAGNVAQGLNPAQPFVNIYKGDRLLRAYLGKLDSPDLAPIVDAIQQAGGRVKMDDFYRNATVNAFKQALRSSDYPGAAKALLPTLLDRIGAPVFEQLVPRQKLGVFFDMAKDWLEQNPRADVAAKREGLGKLWDSVDNRMGQLVYDNVFWNRILKDGLMATVRSVGWNLGTFRELGGGVLDLKDIVRNRGLSDRTAYVVALPMVAAIYGSIANYLYTGEPPETLKDAFYPRTGRLRPDGSEDRVSLPTYMKDVFAYGEDAHNFAQYGATPLQTLKNKANPLISTISQMLNNEDFFGGAIRNPADPATRQIMDEAAYLLQQVEPFSLRNYQQQAKEKGEEPSVLGYLTSPAMVGVAPAPGYITKSAEQLESGQVSRMREPLIQKYREALKGGSITVDDAVKEMIKGGLSRRDMQYVIRSSGDVPKPARLKRFGGDAENE